MSSQQTEDQTNSPSEPDRERETKNIENGSDQEASVSHVTGEQPPSEQGYDEDNQAKVSGFWRRLIAFVIDVFLLGIFGNLVGSLFYENLIHLPIVWGRAIGFLIALAYFGLLNSDVGDGQTLGKKLLGIKVQSRSGENLSLPTSCLRFTVLGLFYFLNGLQFPIGWIAYESLLVISTPVLALLVFGFGGTIVYLFIFNRQTRQSLHDLVVDSVVVYVESEGETVDKPVWWWHKVIGYGWLGLVFLGSILTTGTFMFSNYRFGFGKQLENMKKVVENLQKHPNVMEGGARQLTHFSGDKTTTRSFSVWARWKGKPEFDLKKKALKEFGDTVTEGYRFPDQLDYVIVKVVYGYDIGIASFTWSRIQQFRASRFRSR